MGGLSFLLVGCVVELLRVFMLRVCTSTRRALHVLVRTSSSPIQDASEVLTGAAGVPVHLIEGHDRHTRERSGARPVMSWCTCVKRIRVIELQVELA